MDKLDELKLAIYERAHAGEITDEDCAVLIEAAEMKYGEDIMEESDEEFIDSIIGSMVNGDITYTEACDIFEEATGQRVEIGVYIKGIRTATESYKKSVSKVNASVRSKDFAKAKAQLVVAKADLKKVKALVDKAPETLNENGFKQVIGYVKGCIIAAKKDDNANAKLPDKIVGASLGVAKSICMKIINVEMNSLENYSDKINAAKDSSAAAKEAAKTAKSRKFNFC